MTTITIDGENAPPELIPIPGRCNARRTDGSGLLCRNRAGKGTDHVGHGRCYKHAGNTVNHIAHNRQAVAEAAVLRLCDDNALPVLDPALELSQLAGAMRSWQRAARQLVGELDRAGLLVDGDDVHPLVKLAERADERLQRILAEMAKLGFAERAIQIDETVAAAVVAKVLETFVELGQDPAPYVALLAPKLAALDAVTTTGKENTP